MRKVLMLIAVALITTAMSAAAFAKCGCGGGKFKPESKPDVVTKA